MSDRTTGDEAMNDDTLDDGTVNDDTNGLMTRRGFLVTVLRGGAALVVTGTLGALAARRGRRQMVWQIDPTKCTQCGQCATHCVLDVSAVKCMHEFAMCGYCKLCLGYFVPDPNALDSGAENQLCPVDAIRRTFIEDPYYEYTIDESLCYGCGKCVKGCAQFGNGSLYLQVRHDRCLNCNECAIAAACPADAFVRVPAGQAVIRKYRGS